jgi:hypothetical protein
MRSESLYNFTLSLCLSWILASQASGISRIGPTSVNDIDLGFKAPIAKDFAGHNDSILVNKGFRVQTDFTPRNREGNPYYAFLRFSPLDLRFHKMATLERDEFRKAIKAEVNQWVGYPSANSCVDTYIYRDADRIVGMAFWGGGKGFSILSGASTYENWAMEQTLANIELYSGACGWD